MAPISKYLKKEVFEWTKATEKAFKEIKHKLYQAPVLALPNFDDLLEVECDATRVGIGAILVQSKRPIGCFSERLNRFKCNCSTYDKEFVAIARASIH